MVSSQGSVAGLGPGVGIAHPSTGSSGAGHGGRGGSGTNQPLTGAFYGNVYKPQAFGSSGGGGPTSGGGVLHVNTTELNLDGKIEVDGQSAEPGTSNGGGSGGSIYLVTGTFAGSGVLQASGGDGGNAGGGGGSGGRIAVYYRTSLFSGQATAYGGASPVEAGAAGTVFLKDTEKDKTLLQIENRGRVAGKLRIGSFTDLSSDSARTWLTRSSLDHNVTSSLADADIGERLFDGFVFDEVKLGRSAHLAIEPEVGRARLHSFKKFTGTFEGDSFGFVHVGPKQFLVVSATDYYIPLNLRIYRAGYVKLPPRIMLHKNSLTLDEGSLFGVRDLTISECSVEFGLNSAAQDKGTPKPMVFEFNSITLMNAGKLLLTTSPEKYHLRVGTLLVNPGGLLEGKLVSIEATRVLIEESGRISLDGQGDRCAPTNAFYAGSGGSHAGYGGLGRGSLRDEPFDFFFVPSKFGLAGRSGRASPGCNAGFGGGALELTVTGTLWLDGTISAR